MPTSSTSVSGSGAGASASLKTPFMAGSLLQQRVEAEKQEVEYLKLQLRLREQAGVLGARNAALASDHHSNSRGHSSSGSSALPHSSQHYQLQQALPLPTALQQAQPKFGGPGTLIEQGEVRAAQLARSKSAGGLLRPSPAHAGMGGAGRRNRSRSRGPSEDYVARQAGSDPPHSYSSPDSSPGSSNNSNSVSPTPQGPLLHFDDPDAMIQPGLLLSRAKSMKQLSSSTSLSSSTPLSSSSSSSSTTLTKSPRGGSSSMARQASSGGILGGQTLIGLIEQKAQSAQSGQTGQSVGGGGPRDRTRSRPLVNLGSSTSNDVIGPGLLKSGGNNRENAAGDINGARLARSPSRRTKPLLEF
ncbi:hypothetical protein BGZ98_007622 [Dissophora globulifera]|nr:hypothetical protein BGZ98_007622 [Dissophora globulifera]